MNVVVTVDQNAEKLVGDLVKATKSAIDRSNFEVLNQFEKRMNDELGKVTMSIQAMMNQMKNGKR